MSVLIVLTSVRNRIMFWKVFSRDSSPELQDTLGAMQSDKNLQELAGVNADLLRRGDISKAGTYDEFKKSVWKMREPAPPAEKKRDLWSSTRMLLAVNKMQVNLHGLSGSGAADLVRRTIYNCDPQRYTAIEFIVGTDSHRGTQTVMGATRRALAQIFKEQINPKQDNIGIYPIELGTKAQIELVKPRWLPVADPDKTIRGRRVKEIRSEGVGM